MWEIPSLQDMDVSLKNQRGQNALEIGVKAIRTPPSATMDIIRQLCLKNWDIVNECKEIIPLQFTIQFLDNNIVKLLIQLGCDAVAVGVKQFRNTILHGAASTLRM